MATTDTASLRGARVLVTGGMGFIGSNLAHRLVRLGARVRIVDSLDPGYGGNRFNLDGVEVSVEITVGDLRDPEVVATAVRGQEIVFNLAAKVSHLGGVEQPEVDLSTNAGAALALVQACRRLTPDARLVYAGTRQVYGRPRYLPVDESHPVDPVDFNGISKRAGELYHLVSHRVFGQHAVSLRMTNVYGPRMRVRDNRLSFIGWWIRPLVEGRSLEVYGNGQQLRDFNHVDDVVDAMLAAAVNPRADGQVYNLGHPEPVRLVALARLLVELNGGGEYRLVPFPRERERIDIGDYYADFSRIRADLGWSPTVPLADGLRRTIAYYREHRSRYWT